MCTVLSHVWLFVTPWTATCWAPQSMGILQNTGVGCHALLQGIFPTQGLNPSLLYCRQNLYQLSNQGKCNIQEIKTWLNLGLTFTFHFHALEKEMATHSSVLAWRIPETGEPGGVPSMGSHRVRHDWSDLAAAAEQEGWRLKALIPVSIKFWFFLIKHMPCA